MDNSHIHFMHQIIFSFLLLSLKILLRNNAILFALNFAVNIQYIARIVKSKTTKVHANRIHLIKCLH